jgi:hypothetical protein
MEDQFENIVATLRDKAILKQHIYRNTLEVFQRMKAIGRDLTRRLSERFVDVDKEVVIDFVDDSEFEFTLKFSGDVLIFTMQTNVQTFGEEHILRKSPYILKDDHRGYYGAITVYNFMADSLKYNRLNDPGYLLARMVVNFENHFYIEGVRQMSFLHPDIAENIIDEPTLQSFIEGAILMAVEQDLYAPAFHDVQFIPLGLKLQDQMAGAAKVGFQMRGQGRGPDAG